MPSTRDLRRRIKGIKNTGKITRAMEMISAVKMRRAVEKTLSLRPYAGSAFAMLHELYRAGGDDLVHPLLTAREVKRQLYVVITSQRGLCGAFNAQVLKKLKQTLDEDRGREAVFVSLGKKGDAALRRMDADLIASFPETAAQPTPENVRPVARLLIDEYQSGRVDRIVMVYTDYVSVMRQEVKVRALLPIIEKDVKKSLHRTESGSLPAEAVVEPAPYQVLDRMIPRLIEIEIYHALLESNASQEAARMMAMRNATDAAKEMADSFTLAYNQLRQMKVTQEIAELSAGRAALEN